MCDDKVKTDVEEHANISLLLKETHRKTERCITQNYFKHPSIDTHTYIYITLTLIHTTHKKNSDRRHTCRSLHTSQQIKKQVHTTTILYYYRHTFSHTFNNTTDVTSSCGSSSSSRRVEEKAEGSSEGTVKVQDEVRLKEGVGYTYNCLSY